MFQKINKHFWSYRKYFFIFVSFFLLLLFGRLIYGNLELVLEAVTALKEAEKTWIVIGLILFYSGVVFNALILIILSFKKLPLILTLKEQTALLFVNKVLPAGVGQLTLNSYYLHKEENTKSQIASILTAKAIASGIALGIFVIYFLFINWEVIVGVFNFFNLNSISFEKYIILGSLIFTFILLFIFYLSKHKSIKKRIMSPINNYKTELLKYKDSPEKIVYSTLFAILVVLSSILTLWASAFAVGIDLGFRDVLFIFISSILIAGLIPVPGGIGTTEIGLYFGFYVVGVDPVNFISAILIYRFINYWLPLGVGYLFFLNLRKNILKSFTLSYQSSDTIR